MATSSHDADARDAVDLGILRDATAGERDLMQELAELYVNDADLQLRALTDALESQETDRIRRIGHALKGASVSIGARPASAIFAELESAAAAGDLERIAKAIDRGRREFARVRRALGDLR